MKFYKEQHQYYCGIDLHAKMMYVCVVNNDGKVLYHKNLPANKEAFINAISLYRDNLLVGVECMFCWYWLADLKLAKKKVGLLINFNVEHLRDGITRLIL